MGFEIEYKDRYTGKTQVHRYSGNESSARGWAEVLAQKNSCKAVCIEVTRAGRTHIVSEGHDEVR